MTEKAFEQMMSGLKQAKEEYGRTVFPDCRSKYYAVRDAIELLKKQEPKNPRIDTIGQPVCPNDGCHHRLSLMLKQKYCDVCGQAVKWE